jgi:hypothetical protein
VLDDPAALRAREEARARTAQILAELDSTPPRDMFTGAEGVLGQEGTDKIKGVLERVGVRKEGGWKLFRRTVAQREFKAEWVGGVWWLQGFEGLCGVEVGLR